MLQRLLARLSDDLLWIVWVFIGSDRVTHEVVVHGYTGFHHRSLRPFLFLHDWLLHVKGATVFLIGHADARHVWMFNLHFTLELALRVSIDE